jgi:hypothetical protein
VRLAARVAGSLGIVAAALLQSGCGTCRGGPAVVARPSVGGSIGSSGASTWSSPGVGIDVSQLFCRPPDPATEQQPGPGSPPIKDPAPNGPKSQPLPPGAAPI